MPRRACGRPASTRSAPSPPSGTRSSGRSSRAASAHSCATARRGVDPRDLDLELEPVSVSAEDTFPRDLTDRERLHDEVRRLAELVSERLGNAGLSGRTVTAKLRYADFSIRTRSTTLPAAVDDATVIGNVACGLLDRGLRDRPGALRLVGVGVSGLSPYRQLSLDES